jgi:hypothetical protein
VPLNYLSPLESYLLKDHYALPQMFLSYVLSPLVLSQCVQMLMLTHTGNYKPGRMVVGQTFTIEPMLTMGSIQPVRWDDQWTVVTKDGSLSAQFEHTVLITENGAEVLTQSISIEGEE